MYTVAYANGVIADASVGVAMYVHSAVCIAIQVGLGPVKSSGYEDLLAYVRDVSCVVIMQ
jgi:hypothetical protein